MDRNEAEARIAGLLREIRGAVEEYGGTSGYLNLVLRPRKPWDRPAISFNNEYWPDGDDVDRPLNYFEFEEEEEEE